MNNDFKRMQQLAGVITESQLNEAKQKVAKLKILNKNGTSTISKVNYDPTTNELSNIIQGIKKSKNVIDVKVEKIESYLDKSTNESQLNEDEKLSNPEFLKLLKATNMGHLYNDIINIPASDADKVILGMKLIYDNFDCEPNGGVIKDIIGYLRQKSDNESMN